MAHRVFHYGLILLAGASLTLACTSPPENNDVLPSWQDGNTKAAIENFVEDVSDPSSENFVPPEDRIATFDNDGTLWAEQPFYFQLFFALDRIKQLAPEHPEWESDSLMTAVINGDTDYILKSGMRGLLEIVMRSHTGMSTEEFDAIVMDWIDTASHPQTGKPYPRMVYQPMLELLDYLRAKDFKVYIVSGGGIEFMRPWTSSVYGIPPENVVGSSVKVQYEVTPDGPVLMRLPELDFIDDKEGKPVGIHRHIGKRPLAAFGNSDGDLQMLQWTAAGDGRRLMVYIHHTDADREWAYDRESHIGRLDKGLDEAAANDWTIVDMKNDWKTIYPE